MDLNRKARTRKQHVDNNWSKQSNKNQQNCTAAGSTLIQHIANGIHWFICW